MEIKKIQFIDQEMQVSFQEFLSKAEGYEPYYSLEKNSKFLSYILIDKGEIISYIGALLINKDEASEGFIEDEASKNLYEISALTSPNYRNQGFFKTLLKELIADKSMNSNFIMPVEDEFKSASFLDSYIYSEYLYLLKKEDFLKEKDKLEEQAYNVDHYTAFSEDYTQFFLYLDANEDNETNSEIYGVSDTDLEILNSVFNEDEPAAVLNINFSSKYATIYGVFVDEDKRNKGLGFALLYDSLEEFYKHFDLPLVLNVTSTNIAACKLYKKAGFKSASQVNYYAITSPIS